MMKPVNAAMSESTTSATPAAKPDSATAGQQASVPASTTGEGMDNQSSDTTMADRPSSGTDAANMGTTAKDTPDKDTPDPVAEASATAAAKLKTGSFRDADRAHKGSGQATIYRGPDGSHVLRLEDLNVTNGPDLHVILTPHPISPSICT